MKQEDKIHTQINSTIKKLGIENTELVYFGSVAKFPTTFGNEFLILGVHSLRDMKDHAVILKGEPVGKKDVPVRIHSECLTGDVFTSQRCDCRAQLEYAMKYLAKQKTGVLIYLRQEGRGIGLFNKLKAYTLQDQGYDTFQANEILGFKADERTYEIAIDILKGLNIDTIKLLTNNPAKVEGLCDYGINVSSRVPIIIEATQFSEKYLDSKSEKGHLIKKGEFSCSGNE